MLEELVVDGLGAIDHAEIGLGPGLSALTGETGAGKTLLVAALGLLTGERADRSRVREGSAETVVEGRFIVPAEHPALSSLIEQEVVEPTSGEVELVLSRTVPASGKAARARVNGRLVTAAVLTEVGTGLVEIAGQNQHQALASPRVQRAMLDAFVGPRATELARQVADAVRVANSAARELATLEAGERERERRLDVLRFEVQEIEKVAPQTGEIETLRTTALRLEHAASIASSVRSARRGLKADAGVVDAARSALSDLAEAAAVDPSLEELRARLETAVFEIEDVAAGLGAVEIDTDPGELERVRGRLAEVARLTRKYGPDETEVFTYLETARRELAELETAAGSLDELQARAASARSAAEDLASELSRMRAVGAAGLSEAIEPQLAELALAGARFEVRLEACALYEGGLEKVEFLVAPNPGESPKPLGKVASGGELSRIALALHVLAGTSSVPTLVFDEVDAGVGGEAAQAVGRALARLAEERGAQVLVVTHLPQVASWADSHHLVEKRNVGGRSSVGVQEIEGERRVEELSRMLAGLPESDRARQHAAELLEIAGRTR